MSSLPFQPGVESQEQPNTQYPTVKRNKPYLPYKQTPAKTLQTEPNQKSSLYTFNNTDASSINKIAQNTFEGSPLGSPLMSPQTSNQQSFRESTNKPPRHQAPSRYNKSVEKIVSTPVVELFTVPIMTSKTRPPSPMKSVGMPLIYQSVSSIPVIERDNYVYIEKPVERVVEKKVPFFIEKPPQILQNTVVVERHQQEFVDLKQQLNDARSTIGQKDLELHNLYQKTMSDKQNQENILFKDLKKELQGLNQKLNQEPQVKIVEVPVEKQVIVEVENKQRIEQLEQQLAEALDEADEHRKHAGRLKKKAEQQPKVVEKIVEKEVIIEDQNKINHLQDIIRQKDDEIQFHLNQKFRYQQLDQQLLDKDQKMQDQQNIQQNLEQSVKMLDQRLIDNSQQNQQQLKQLENLLKDKDKNLQKLRDQELQQSIKSSQSQNQLQQLQKQNQNLKNTCNQQEQHIKDKDQIILENQRLQNQIQNLQQQIADLKDQIQELDDKILREEEAMVQISVQLNAKSLELNDVKQKLETENQGLKNELKQKDDLLQEWQEYVDEANVWEQKYKQMTQQLSIVSNEITHLDSDSKTFVKTHPDHIHQTHGLQKDQNNSNTHQPNQYQPQEK